MRFMLNRKIILYIFMLFFLVSNVSAGNTNIIMSNDQTGTMLANILPFISLVVVIFAAAIIIKIIIMMRD